jgi:hypothetical protein
MNKVYVIQATPRQADVSPAQSYGAVEFILSSNDRMSSSPELHIGKLTRALEKFDEQRDYILWAGGDPLSCLLTGYALRELGISTFRYLRYEKPDARKPNSAPFYVPVTVTPFPD